MVAVLIGGVLGGILCVVKAETVEMTPEQMVLSGAYVAPPETQIRMSQGSFYRKLYEKQTEYLRESFLMQMDANRVYTGTAEYYLEAEDDTGYLGEKFKTILSSNEFMLKLQNIVGREKELQYVQELLECQVVFNESVAVEKEQGIRKNAVITYTVSFGEKSVCDAILQAVKEKVESTAEEYQVEYKIGRFEKIYDGIELIVNQNIRSLQKTSTDNANSYVTNYARSETEFNANPLDVAYYDIVYRKMDTTGIETYNMGVRVPISVKTAVKWLLVGLILSVGLWSIWYVVRYLLDTSVKTAEEIKNNYGLSLLGYMDTGYGSQNSVDRWIEKCARKYRRSPDSLEYINSMIDLLEKKSIILCGGAGDETEQQLKNIISGKTSLHVSEFVHQSGEALQMARNTDGEILIIRRGKTCHQEIVRELEVCSMQEIMVLGAIVIG